MPSNIKRAYQASANLTVTNLASIATSSTLVAGWLSGIIDNTTDLDLDKLISGKVVLGNSATAGQIALYAIAMLDDSNWPTTALTSGTFGTEGTGAFKDTTNRDAVAMLVWAAGTRADPGTDDTYQLAVSSLAGAFGGVLPAKLVLFLTHSTGVNLASSGHQVTCKGMYETVG
jgi:hypothetical protein